jgi:hypothetical protein
MYLVDTCRYVSGIPFVFFLINGKRMEKEKEKFQEEKRKK